MGRDLSRVLDAVLAGIVVLDTECGVELVNSAACRMLETSAEAAVGRPLERLFGADDAVPALVRKVIRGGGSASENALRIERRHDDDLSST